MISANVIKGVQELLEARGMKPEQDETFGDMVARKLDISEQQTEILLERLDEGATVAEAAAAAGIEPGLAQHETLMEIARAIGTVLGRLRS